MRSQIKSLFHVVVIAILNVSVLAGGVYLPSRYFTRSHLMKHQEPYSPSRSRRLSKFCLAKDETATIMVSRNQELDEEMAPADRKSDELSYNDLGPIGKTIAGVTEIVFTTAFDFCSGYLQGFLFGTLFGSPGFIFRPVTKGVRQPFRTELSGRFARMNVRSTSWAKTLGTFSAAFGGFGVAVKVLRNGEQDAWSDILSTAAAGAFFGRKEGPAGMIKGALLYGGMIYLTSGSRRGQIQDYTEKPALEF